MVARHASGLRLPVFALAGSSGVRSTTFLIADGLSALAAAVGAAVWVLLARRRERRAAGER